MKIGLTKHDTSLRSKQKNFSIEFILILILLTSMYFDMSDSGRYYNKIIIILIMFLAYVIKNSKICVEKQIYIFYLFSVVICASGIYGIDNRSALGNIVVVISCAMLMLMISNNVVTENRIKIFFEVSIILAIILSIRVIWITDFQRFLQGTYYPDVIIQRYIGNRNIVSLMIGLGFNFCIYMICNYKKYIYGLAGFIMFITTLLTGSRKGLLICITPWVIFFGIKFLKSRKIMNKLKLLFITVIMCVVTFNIIMKVEVIYDTVGFRIEAMYRSVVYGEVSHEGSFNTRQNMISKGKEYFKDRPILGHGVSTYRYIYKHDMGKETYSHNNYIELLVNNGIVGFTLYYIFYIWNLVICNKKRILTNSEKEKNYYLFILSILITMLILDNGRVAYNDYITYLLIGLSMRRLPNYKMMESKK
ncbi:O-antigen ligase family protein [Paraclostridium sordellii]|uniref:O-antigen ligase family protein n=1 Tax=Paraclostridium sordellii TaxID=1505 RepID=UPI001C612D92|nr:O-antigen ligase family protein [Paeniclostridium sordellii]QYE97371.1 O-antigen ligase family protein [Paeniclostridium sordellii]